MDENKWNNGWKSGWKIYETMDEIVEESGWNFFPKSLKIGRRNGRKESQEEMDEHGWKKLMH